MTWCSGAGRLAGPVVLAAVLACAAPVHGQAPAPLSLLDVPFLSQSEALCGGAAAAMVLRYWGDTSARPEQFAPLVDEAAGGIPTRDLVAALRERGWTAHAVAGDGGRVRRELDEGRPVITLIEVRPDVYHYVVIVGWHDRAVVLHDPARTPNVLLSPREFAERWRAAGSWMLVLVPGGDGPLTPPPADDATAATPAVPCDLLVAEGVGHARADDLAAADRILTEAAYRCPGAAPLRELAGLRLLQRRWDEVAALANDAVRIDPADAHAWRLLGASRFVLGDHDGALAAWNRAGEPVLDLVTVHGLRRTTHRAVERVLDLDPDRVLSGGAVARARRRLAELPSAFSSRLELVPRGGARMDVRAHVAERDLIPRSPLAWAAMGLEAAAEREARLHIASLAAAGERLTLRWRFWPGRPAYGVALQAPVGAGMLRLEGYVERQPFTASDVADAERTRGSMALSDWATGAFRWEARAGIDRWRTDGTYGRVGMGVRIELPHTPGLAFDLEADGWAGDRSFGGARLDARWQSSSRQAGTVVLVSGGTALVSSGTPLDLWPAGDNGHARPSLLRAHPVLDDGRLRVERLGRHLVNGTVELRRWWPGPAVVRTAGAVFVDAAHTGRRLSGESVDDVDLGVGARIALPGSRGVLRVDVARGLRDGRHSLSVGWLP